MCYYLYHIKEGKKLILEIPMKKFTLSFIVALAAFGGYVNDCNAMHLISRMNMGRKSPSSTYPTITRQTWTSPSSTRTTLKPAGKPFWERIHALAKTNTGSNILSCLSSFGGGFFNSIALAIATRAGTNTFPNLISWKNYDAIKSQKASKIYAIPSTLTPNKKNNFDPWTDAKITSFLSGLSHITYNSEWFDACAPYPVAVAGLTATYLGSHKLAHLVYAKTSWPQKASSFASNAYQGIQHLCTPDVIEQVDTSPKITTAKPNPFMPITDVQVEEQGLHPKYALGNEVHGLIKVLEEELDNIDKQTKINSYFATRRR
jgi:hypothetical protein